MYVLQMLIEGYYIGGGFQRMKKEHVVCVKKHVVGRDEVMSLMRMRKSIGPRMEPWGTSDLTGRGVEMQLPTLIDWI